MASVFLSYDREDAAHARAIAGALEKSGHSVWWDRHIRGGAQYSKEIDKALRQADAVVVLWSERSVESAWVRDEAATGRDSGRLVPVALDSTEPPLGFRQYQTLKAPGGRLGRAGKQALLDALVTTAGLPEGRPADRPRRSQANRIRLAWITLTIAMVVAVGVGLFLWRPWVERGEIVVAIGPGGADASSRTLARDLAIKLSTQQMSFAFPIRLIETTDASTKPELVFEAASSGPANASLILKSASNSAILWSKDFEQPSGNRADLIQQVTYTAARIIGCAMEGLAGPVKLDPAPLKTYLNACAQLSEIATASPDPPLAMLLEVVAAEPKFTPAWSKLLLAESEYVAPMASQGESDPKAVAQLRKHIAQAREVDPHMPEASIADASLLKPSNFSVRTKLISAAAARKPDDSQILTFLAGSLSATGRIRDAVGVAGEAARRDPLSPGIHANYTGAIMYSGAFDAAKRELAKAEKLWPGTDSLWDMQFRFHYRYGDPRIARRILEEQSDSDGGMQRVYLDARENPTPQAIDKLLDRVRERLRNMENPSAGIGFAALAFAQFNRKEDLFGTLLAWPKPDDIAVISEVLFRPEFKEIRRDPRFMLVAKRAGLLDYWRTSGKWPDFCFEPDQTYDCKKEAARLPG